MSQNNWEADKIGNCMLQPKTFQAEGKVSTDPVAIDAPGGFLFEWWSVFWYIFIARTNEKHSEPAASYLETQLAKAKESQQQQQMQHPKPQQHQQMQTQQLLLQRHAQQQQQQRRDVNRNLMANGPATSDNSRHSSPTASSLAAKMYEDKLKLPFQRDSLGDAAMKQGLNDNTGQLLDPNNASMLKAAALSGQPGQTLHGAGCLLQTQNRNQQIPVSTQGIKSDVNAMMYPAPRISRMEGPLIGSHGSNQVGNNLPLKGWPLAGVDQLGLLQHQRSLQSTQQPPSKLQLQQQLILQAQQNLASPSASELDRRKLQMLLANQNMGVGNSSDVLSNIGSAMHAGPVLPQRDIDSIAKQQQLQNMNPQQQHYSQQPLSSQQSQNSNQQVQQQEKTIGPDSSTVEGALSQGNDQTLKGQIGRKRKPPGSFSGPANSSGTANTTGPSPSSPSTPSTHTAGDAMSLPALSHDGGSSKSLLIFGSDGMGSLASAPNELADMDRMVNDRTLKENVDSFFSHDALDPKDRVGQPMDISKGFTFSKIRVIPASTSKVECCHFSSDGKLLATGGHDKKVTLWCTETFKVKSVLEEHSQWITDVRFGPNVSRLATSSADKTVRVWDVDNPGYSLRTFMGHATTVTSVDFHPSKEDLICSCDDNGEMRCWSIKNGSCTGVFKGGVTLTRFQPRFERILAAAAGNSVSLLDVETQVCRLKLQGHENSVHSVTWDPSGERLASVSDDLIRVWAVHSSSKGECIHELSCTGNKFHPCVFHPMYPSLLIIGCYKTIELWNMTENKTMTLQAHEKLVSSLAVSYLTGLVASASHDKCVKLWK